MKWKKGYIALYGNSWPIRIYQFFMGKEKRVQAGALPPFMFFSDESYEHAWLVNHELIHFRQVFELFFIGALIILVIENVYARVFLGYSALDAYHYSALEQEAYLNHHNPNYLKFRKPFAILYYICNKKKFSIDKNGIVSIQ